MEGPFQQQLENVELVESCMILKRLSRPLWLLYARCDVVLACFQVWRDAKDDRSPAEDDEKLWCGCPRLSGFKVVKATATFYSFSRCCTT